MIAIGVDTHKATHTAVASNSLGEVLAETEVSANESGYKKLLKWSYSFGSNPCFGIEGTGSYGAGLCEFLLAKQVVAYEVEQPKRKQRRRGKSDSIDALLAAKTVLSGEGISKPRSRGAREALRVTLCFYNSCVNERTRLTNQLEAMFTAAPNHLRLRTGKLSGAALVARVAVMRCARADMDVDKTTLSVMKDTVKRIRALDPQIAQYYALIKDQVVALNHGLLAEPGVGPITAARLLVIDAGRFERESQFARANGTAPIPASSGNTRRQRLNRGGDRQANFALHTIALTRCRCHEESRRYYEKKLDEGMSKREAMRCLKRKTSRRLYRLLVAT